MDVIIFDYSFPIKLFYFVRKADSRGGAELHPLWPSSSILPNDLSMTIMV